MALENVDPTEERVWGEKMQAERKIFMANKDKEEAGEANDDGTFPPKTGKGRGRGGRRGVSRKKAGTSKLSKNDRELSPSSQIFVEDELSSKGLLIIPFPFVPCGSILFQLRSIPLHTPSHHSMLPLALWHLVPT